MACKTEHDITLDLLCLTGCILYGLQAPIEIKVIIGESMLT